MYSQYHFFKGPRADFGLIILIRSEFGAILPVENPVIFFGVTSVTVATFESASARTKVC